MSLTTAEYFQLQVLSVAHVSLKLPHPKMTRSVKDLRELVCVSRLTMREDEEAEDLSRPLTSLSLFEESPAGNRSTAAFSETPSVIGADKNYNNNAGGMSSADFLANPKCPLPPVGSNSRPSSGDKGPKVDSVKARSDERQGFYDDVLQYIGDDSTGEWLLRANQEVAKLADWCQTGENFVDFAHFWLTEFALSEQVSLLKLEIGIILEEVAFCLQDAINQEKIHDSDVKGLFASLFPEYPQKLCSPRGQYIFLNILDTLSSGRDKRYRRLLTDVRMSSSQSSSAQKALAIRAYIVISMWGNIVHFYRRIKGLSPDCGKSPQNPCGGRNHLFQAVRGGRVRVVHYLLRNSFGSPGCEDDEGRSLVFLSVLHNQPRVLKYLMAKHPDHLSLAEPCHSGNTCVHVAANLGHTECLQLLLESGRADVNQKNLQCEGATPLHLAVMQGNTESVELLLKAGADRDASMNGVSPWQLADQLGHEEVKPLLQ